MKRIIIIAGLLVLTGCATAEKSTSYNGTFGCAQDPYCTIIPNHTHIW